MTKTKTKFKSAWPAVKRANGVFLAAFVCLIVLMLISTNYANSQSLERAELDKQIRNQEDELRLLNTAVSELKTTERVEQESQRLNLVRVQTENIYYLGAEDSQVALRK